MFSRRLVMVHVRSNTSPSFVCYPHINNKSDFNWTTSGCVLQFRLHESIFTATSVPRCCSAPHPCSSHSCFSSIRTQLSTGSKLNWMVSLALIILPPNGLEVMFCHSEKPSSLPSSSSIFSTVRNENREIF